jgi:RNA polymerase sigma-70 factor (ECF subfamily)
LFTAALSGGEAECNDGPAAETERCLVERLKALEPDAVRQLYAEHADALYRYALYQTSDPAVAEDIVAEVFLRFLENVSSYEYRGRPVAAWLFRTARNLALDHHRRKLRRPTTGLEGVDLPAADDPLERAEVRLSAAELAVALEALTPEQREVIALRFVEGYDTARVAALLQKSEGAIKSLQHRALGALRRALEGRGRGR